VNNMARNTKTQNPNGFPPSVVKINKNGMYFESNVDCAKYTITQLVARALIDCGRLLKIQMNRKAQKILKGMAHNPRVRGKTSAFTTKYEKDNGQQVLKVGTRGNHWYSYHQELGSSKQPKLGIIENTTTENLQDIIKIQKQYLGTLDDESEAFLKASENAINNALDEMENQQE